MVFVVDQRLRKQNVGPSLRRDNVRTCSRQHAWLPDFSCPSSAVPLKREVPGATLLWPRANGGIAVDYGLVVLYRGSGSRGKPVDQPDWVPLIRSPHVAFTRASQLWAGSGAHASFAKAGGLQERSRERRCTGGGGYHLVEHCLQRHKVRGGAFRVAASEGAVQGLQLLQDASLQLHSRTQRV